MFKKRPKVHTEKNIKFSQKVGTYFKALTKLNLLFTYFRIAYHEWLYKVHLRIRKAHDNTYQKVNWYKDWTDKKYSSSIHKAVLASFIFSFVFFSVFQTMLPFWNKPEKAMADSRYVIWTTQADFENNDSTTDTPSSQDGNLKIENEISLAHETANLDISGMTAVASGCSHTVALKNDGTVWAWGNGKWDGLGDGLLRESLVPVQASGLAEVTAVSAGCSNSLALKSDGTVWAWGDNGSGQLGNGTTTDSTVPVQVLNLTDVTAISAASWHGLALKSDGTVWAWGYNYDGELGNGTTTDATVPVQVSNLTGVTAIESGDFHSLALKSDGTVWAWGDNGGGVLGNGTYNTDSNIPVQVSNITDITMISGAGYHSFAVESGGTVWSWGNNDSGQLGNGTSTYSSIPVQVLNISNPLMISGGVRFSFALKYDGTVWSWGSNGAGELGNGTNIPSNVPAQVPNIIDVKYISLGSYTSSALALKDDGTVWGWGKNGYGQLGNGSKLDSNIPVHGENPTELPTYKLTGTISGLKATTGGPVASWNDGSIYADVPIGTQVDVFYRVANSEAELSEAGWHYNPAFSCGNNCGTSLLDIDNSSLWSPYKGSWIEFKMDFTSFEGSATPVVHDFSLSYDAINTPQNITTVNKTGGESLRDDWAKESAIIVKADIGWLETFPYTYQMGTVDFSVSDGTFEHTDTGQLAEGVIVQSERLLANEINNSQLKLAEISGLEHGKTYTYRVRVSDYAGRTSVWSNPATVKVDLENPNLGGFNINEGNVKTNQRIVNLNLDFSDADSGISEMRFSNDSQTWSNWENYQTEKAWNLSSGDGVKTVYAQAKDAAGNISGRTWDSSSDFGAAALSQGLEIGNNISLSAALENQDITISTTEKNKIAANDFTAALVVDINGNLYGAGYDDGLGIAGGGGQPVKWQRLKLPEDKKAKEVYANDCGDSVFVIAEDGTLYIAGYPDDYGLDYTDGWAVALDQYNSPITDVKQLSAGYDHVMIIRSDNKAWGAGDAEYSDLSGGYIKFSRIPTLLEDISQVAAACYGHSLALTSGGTLKGRGGDQVGEPDGTWSDPFHTIAGGWNGVKKIKASVGHSMLEDNDGYIWATGQTYGYVGITGQQYSATGGNWIKNGIQNPKDFFSTGEGSFIINGENTIYHELASDGTFSGVTSTYPVGSALYAGYCGVFPGAHCPAQGVYKLLDYTNTYLDFVSGWNSGLGLETSGHLYAWGDLGNYIGFPGEGQIIERRVDNAISGFLDMGYLGSLTEGGGGLKFSNNSTLKPTNLSIVHGGGSSPNMGVKIAYRVSDDGTVWSDLKGRDGEAINWETNYLGADGDINNGNIYGQIAGSDVGKFIELVVKLEGDGTISPYLDTLKLETAFTDTITLETVGPEIDFDPNNKYPNENWNVKENVNSLEYRFTTNKPSVSYIAYGLTDTIMEAHGSDSYSTSHAIKLANLGANTTYKYRIRIFDELGNMGLYPPTGSYEAKTTSADTGFDGSPLVSSMSQVEITASSAKITWKTKVPTSSYVDFGLDTNYGDSAGDESLNTNHVVELKNLTAGKVYHYKVRGKDSAGNEYASSDFTFKAIMNPEISNIKVAELTPYTATITFDTNVSTDTALNFGEGLPYSNREYKDERVNNHTITLKNLVDMTTYNYQVEIRDEYGNIAKSQNLTFNTPLDTEGPKISDVKIDMVPVESDDTTAQVIVSWKTSKPATAKIEYDEGVISSNYSKSTIEDSSLNVSHTSIIKELNPGTAYHFRIISKDKRENETKSTGYAIVTPAKQKSIWQLILKSIEDTFSWVKDMPRFWREIMNKA